MQFLLKSMTSLLFTGKESLKNPLGSALIESIDKTPPETPYKQGCTLSSNFVVKIAIWMGS